LVKVSKVKYRGEERQIETLKKTFLAMAEDLRVIFVKLVDRIHNIQTLQYHPKKEKRDRIVEETMKIYVPIAKRLGLYHYQLYLENGCFAIDHYKECMRIVNDMEKHYSDRSYTEK
jgi:GTP pyrophosphokinase